MALKTEFFITSKEEYLGHSKKLLQVDAVGSLSLGGRKWTVILGTSCPNPPEGAIGDPVKNCMNMDNSLEFISLKTFVNIVICFSS